MIMLTLQVNLKSVSHQFSHFKQKKIVTFNCDVHPSLFNTSFILHSGSWQLLSGEGRVAPQKRQQFITGSCQMSNCSQFTQNPGRTCKIHTERLRLEPATLLIWPESANCYTTMWPWMLTLLAERSFWIRRGSSTCSGLASSHTLSMWCHRMLLERASSWGKHHENDELNLLTNFLPIKTKLANQILQLLPNTISCKENHVSFLFR